MRKLMVGVVARNEAPALKGVLSHIPKVILGCNTEVVLFNDGSTDDTVKVAEAYSARVVSLSGHLGMNVLQRCAMRLAVTESYDFYVQMDGDGQHDPTQITKVVRKLQEGYGMVISSRYMPSSEVRAEPPLDRKLLNVQVSAAVNALTKQSWSDPVCGFRGYSPAVAKFLADTPFVTDNGPDHYGYVLESLLRVWRAAEYSITEVSHPAIYNGEGKIGDLYKDDKLEVRLERFKVHARHLVLIAKDLGLTVE